jgi:hypothetical protein
MTDNFFLQHNKAVAKYILKHEQGWFKLTEEQYIELARLWHEYLTFGPPINDSTWHPIDFCDWLNTDNDTYSLPAVEAFLREKEQREGTALPEWAQA